MPSAIAHNGRRCVSRPGWLALGRAAGAHVAERHRRGGMGSLAMRCSQNRSKQSSQTVPFKGMWCISRRSRQSLGHPSQMGQASGLRLGKRMTLFMAAPSGCACRWRWPVTQANPLVPAISPVVALAFQLRSHARHFTTRCIPQLAQRGAGNPTEAPPFSQHVGSNRRGDPGGLRGLARRNVDAVSARLVARFNQFERI